MIFISLLACCHVRSFILCTDAFVLAPRDSSYFKELFPNSLIVGLEMK